MEASTPPSTAHTHQADRSRSADRHAAHGNEARDERRPDRIPRQPNIDRSAVEASAVEASAVEASPTKKMQEDTIGRQPPDEPAVNTDSGAAAMARMEAINASNMSLTYGGVGTGGIAGAGGTAVPPLPNQQTSTAQYSQTYGQQLTHGSVGGQQMPAQPPYGQAYQDKRVVSGNHKVDPLFLSGGGTLEHAPLDRLEQSVSSGSAAVIGRYRESSCSL